MNKKAIAILGAIFLLIVGTLGFLIYTKYSGEEPAPPVSTETETEDPDSSGDGDDIFGDAGDGTGEASDTGMFVKISSEQVISPALFLDGKGLTYFNQQGKVYIEYFEEENGVLSLSRKSTIDYPAKPNIEKVLWAPKDENFIVQTSTGGKPSWSFFDLNKKEYVDLPSQISSLDWMPGGEKIFYVWSENGKSSLNVSNPDASGWKEIAEMWEQDDVLRVSPDGLNIAYYQSVNSSATNPIYLTTPDGKIWATLIKEGYNSGVLWSPDGQKFIFSKKEKNTQKYQLWHYDLLKKEEKNLGVLTTVDKAVWSPDSKLVYASVPVEGTAGDGNLTTDKFFRIDPMAANERKEYDPGSQELDGRDLFLNLDGSRLFFRNAQDGGLYYLDLAK